MINVLNEPSSLMTVKEVEEVTGLSHATIYNQIKKCEWEKQNITEGLPGYLIPKWYIDKNKNRKKKPAQSSDVVEKLESLFKETYEHQLNSLTQEVEALKRENQTLIKNNSTLILNNSSLNRELEANHTQLQVYREEKKKKPWWKPW